MQTQKFTIHFEQEFQAKPEEVYRAFTNSTELSSWFCNTASTQPRVEGRFYVHWDTGYYAAGMYLTLEPGHAVSFTWQGRGEPAETVVRVTFTPSGNGTHLVLEQCDLGESEEWQHVKTEMTHGWERGLENLKSILEQGPDLRIVNRPMLGIFFSPLDASEASRLGVPVTEGVKVDDTVEGLGAQKAGLRQEDVIVEMAGNPITNFTQLGGILASKKGGDSLKVGFYRGKEKHEVDMVLSQRPIPEIPASPVDLAAALEKGYQKDMGVLERALAGVTEEEAEYRPTLEAWTVKEIIAHLIHSQRSNQVFINDTVIGYLPIYDGFGDNLNAYVQATAKVYGSLSRLVDQLKQATAETVAFIRNIPIAFTAHKGDYWRLAYALLSDQYHTKTHSEQITEVVNTFRTLSMTKEV